MAANATAVWRVRPSGSNTNGGGYDPGIASAGTDYSQANAAAFSQSSTANTTTAATVLTDLGASFTTALIGNAIWVSGTGITAEFTFITGVPTSTTLTLQTSPGTAGTAVSYNIGGGWANFWTNTTSSGPLVAGNTVYILGSGVPTPASYAYDYTASAFTPVNGSQSAGLVRFIGDPATPGGGVPCIKVGGAICTSVVSCYFGSLWFVASGTSNQTFGVLSAAGGNGVSWIVGCVYDQFGYDMGLAANGSASATIVWQVINTEIGSSVAKRTTNANSALQLSGASTVFGCNVHDAIGPGIEIGWGGSISFCVAAKNGGSGILLDGKATDMAQSVLNCTLDANLGHGVELASQEALAISRVANTLITNHTGAGKYGMTVDAGAQAANDMVKGFVDYNTFYGNTTDTNAISYGTHDSHGGANPYVAESTDNYTLVPAYYNAGTTPSAAFPQNIPGWNG